MAAVIVVDSDVADSVREYASTLDAAHGSSEFSTALRALVGGSSFGSQTPDSAGLVACLEGQLAATPSPLIKLADREFEPTCNLLLHLFSRLYSVESAVAKRNGSDTPLIAAIVACSPTSQLALKDRRSIKATSVLAVLSTVFNLLLPSLPTRIQIVDLILEVAKTSKVDFALLQDSIGQNLVSWAQQCNASQETVRSLFYKFIAIDTVRDVRSLQLIKEFTQTFPPLDQEVDIIAQYALASPVVDVSFIMSRDLDSAVNRKATPLAKVLASYVAGDLISDQGDAVFEKSRILALARFFDQLPGQLRFQYTDFPAEIVKGTDVETLVVDAIKAKVIEGKLNQMEQAFYLARTNRLVLPSAPAEQWRAVADVLQEWKSALTNVDELVKSSRESIVNSSA